MLIPSWWTRAYWQRPLVFAMFCGFFAALTIGAGVLAVRAPLDARALATAPTCGEGPPPCLTVRRGVLAWHSGGSRNRALSGWSVGPPGPMGDRMAVDDRRHQLLEPWRGMTVTGVWWRGDLVEVRLPDRTSVRSADLGPEGVVIFGSGTVFMGIFTVTFAAMVRSARRRGAGWWEWIPKTSSLVRVRRTTAVGFGVLGLMAAFGMFGGLGGVSSSVIACAWSVVAGGLSVGLLVRRL